MRHERLYHTKPRLSIPFCRIPPLRSEENCSRQGTKRRPRAERGTALGGSRSEENILLARAALASCAFCVFPEKAFSFHGLRSCPAFPHLLGKSILLARAALASCAFRAVPEKTFSFREPRSRPALSAQSRRKRAFPAPRIPARSPAPRPPLPRAFGRSAFLLPMPRFARALPALPKKRMRFFLCRSGEDIFLTAPRIPPRSPAFPPSSPAYPSPARSGTSRAPDCAPDSRR